MRLELHPHQVELGALLDQGVETNAVQWPRRTGKTTAVWAWMVGLCETRPKTLIAVTAQTRIKARARWSDVREMLEPSGIHVRESLGSEAFTWANGSRLWVVAPKAEAFRSDAADVVYVDEPQELEPAESHDMEQGIMPLLDTRERGQVILSGTPGLLRAGWFWDSLRAGEKGEDGYAASIHAAAEEDDVDDEATWLRVHRGIGTLTTLDKMRRRHRKMSAQQWAMEYMGLWPGESDKHALSLEGWTRSEVAPTPIPDRFVLAYDCAPDSSIASLVAVWRGEEGVAYVELLAYDTPRAVAKEAYRLSRKHRAAIAYDAMGSNLEVAEMLQRSKPLPKLSPLAMRDMFAGASTLAATIKRGEFRHFGQPDVTAAVDAVTWRTVGDNGRLFGRRASAGDVTSVVAMSAGIVAYDRLPAAASLRIVTSADL